MNNKKKDDDISIEEIQKKILNINIKQINIMKKYIQFK